MKTKTILGTTLLLVLASGLISAVAQGTAFTYQGLLTSGGVPFTGNAEFQPTLWDAPSGGTKIADNSPPQVVVAVSNGLFVLPLDFGASFPGAERWLQLEVRTAIGPFTVLSPRQKLTATPYAITAGNLTGMLPANQLSGTIPSANVSGTYSGAVTFNNAANSFSGNGAGLTSLNASQLTSGTVPDARLAANVARTNQVWLLGGNAGTSPGLNFVGTIDDQPLELRAGNRRALRLEPGGGWPNVIGGCISNFVAAGIGGAAVGGGHLNRVTDNFGTVGGGEGNQAGDDDSGTTYGSHATVAGGEKNLAAGAATTVSGGSRNTNSGWYATIGGGVANLVQAHYATVSGGSGNVIGSGEYSSIGGGRENAAYGFVCTVAGGWLNTNRGFTATIAGGKLNLIEADYATIGGGERNYIAINASNSFIGSGMANAATGSYGTVGGGYLNVAGGQYATVGGGRENGAIDRATVGGGAFNNATGPGATVGGGEHNDASGYSATIGGGFMNKADGQYATVGGGAGNTASGAAVTVGGGWLNDASGDYATVAGGLQNTATNRYATVGGGYINSASGYCATVAGGEHNTASGALATIPGGYGCTATQGGSLAAGWRAHAIHEGAFVLADRNEVDLYSDNTNQLTCRFTGGVRFWSSLAGGVRLLPGATSWSVLCDRNLKEHLQPVDPQDVLRRLVALPLYTWNLRTQDPTIRHLGPTAQDFAAAFGLGETNTCINTVDADGVALAAIQGLNQKLEAHCQKTEDRGQKTEARLQELDAENRALRRELAELKQLVQQLLKSKGDPQ